MVHATYILFQDSAFFKEVGDFESSWHQDGAASPLRGWSLAIWIALEDVKAAMGPLRFARGSHRERFVSEAVVREREKKKKKKEMKRKKKMMMTTTTTTTTSNRKENENASKGKGSDSPRRWWEKASAAEMLGVRGLPLAQRVANVRRLSDADVRARYNVSEGWATESEAGNIVALKAGDATAHLSWTLHTAPPNTGNVTRRAVSVSYFCDGDTVARDMLAAASARDEAKGVRLSASDGPGLVVQLLSDDAATWMPWILSRQLNPDAPLANAHTPLLWPRA